MVRLGASQTPPHDGSLSVEARQLDVAQNASDPSAPFAYTLDTTRPVVTGVRVSLTTITDAEVTPMPQDEELVVVTYDSQFDWSNHHMPGITFTQPVLTDGGSGGPATFTSDLNNSFWLNNPPTAFWAQFDVASTGMPFTGEAITVSGAQDLANRADQVRYVGAETVAIDMVDPPPPLATVSNIEISTPLVTDAATEPGVEEFYVRVLYNQRMSLTASPTIDFSQPLLSDGGAAGVGTFELDRSRSTWQDQSHYIAWYKVTDQNVKYEYNNYSAFSINTVSTPADMAGPLVQSTTTITDATTTTVVHDTGAANFVVLVYYNMDMAGHHPTVTFETFPGYEGAVAAALTPDPDDCGWWNPREYQAAFYVNDVAANVPDVFIDVSGGIDSTHYGAQYFYEGGHFSINIVGPLAQQQTAPKTAALTDAVLSSGALDLSVSAPSSSTTQQQTTLTAADRALSLTGTWLEA